MIDALDLATSSAIENYADTLIATDELQSWAGEVQLILYPAKEMTWRMWINALTAMKKFVILERMNYEWSFIVLEIGMLTLETIRLSLLMTSHGTRLKQGTQILVAILEGGMLILTSL